MVSKEENTNAETRPNEKEDKPNRKIKVSEKKDYLNKRSRKMAAPFFADKGLAFIFEEGTVPAS